VNRNTSSLGTTTQQIGYQLPPIFESDGIASMEEEEDAEELLKNGESNEHENENLEFPVVANLKNISFSQFNFHYISYLLEHNINKPPSSNSLHVWTKRLFGYKTTDQKSQFKSDKSHPLPEGSKISVKLEVSSSSSSAFGDSRKKMNRWMYETNKFECSKDGLMVYIDQSTNVPLVCMSTDVYVTVYIIIPNNITGTMNASILGTVVISAEDLADTPVDANGVTQVNILNILKFYCTHEFFN